jgi:uncharacterized protein (DUF1684 family)
VVSELCRIPGSDRGYQSRTVITSIGYLMPEATWRMWLVASDTADAVAAELATVVGRHAQPYLERLAADPEQLIEAVRATRH